MVNNKKGEKASEGKMASSVYMYRCQTCGFDNNSLCCLDCFDVSKHDDHKDQFELVSVSIVSCDCGDPSKWNPKTFCDIHALEKSKQEKK